jgi:hypothetical protein
MQCCAAVHCEIAESSWAHSQTYNHLGKNKCFISFHLPTFSKLKQINDKYIQHTLGTAAPKYLSDVLTKSMSSNYHVYNYYCYPTNNRTSLNAKHANNKAAKKAKHNRPRKSRPSDINRKAPVYPSFERPSEYTISDAPAAPVTKKSE